MVLNKKGVLLLNERLMTTVIFPRYYGALRAGRWMANDHATSDPMLINDYQSAAPAEKLAHYRLQLADGSFLHIFPSVILG